MKINFLTTCLSGLTGGVIYDENFFKKLSDYFPGQVQLMEDKNFGDEYACVSPNFRRYAKIYTKHASQILDCDYLVINSRLYTRFIHFPWHLNSKCKILLIHHHFNFMTHSGWKRWFHKQLELRFLRRATLLITPNHYTKKIIREVGLTNDIALVEAFIDKRIHNVVSCRKDVIAFVGTVEPRKGLHLGISAFKQFSESHPTYCFKIAGAFKPGSYTDSLKKLVHDLQLEDKITFLGRIDDQQKKTLYEEAKCFLFPSQNEGYGLVLVEAMSYGLPVVAFDNTAMPYTVTNENGCLIPNGDVAHMGQALSNIIDQPGLYEKLQQGAYATIQHLPAQEDIEKEYQVFFQKL